MRELAAQLARGAFPCWVLLEGPLGAGKSTAARLLGAALGARSDAEGSPTFALAHEYPLQGSGPDLLIHLDLYRLEDKEEMQQAGIPAYFWENPNAVVLSEWTSRFPELELALREDSVSALWRIELAPAEDLDHRRIQISRMRA